MARALRNLYNLSEECDLYVHFSPPNTTLTVGDFLDPEAAAAKGIELLWHRRVWYEAAAESHSVNVTVGPLTENQLKGENPPLVRATLVRVPQEGSKVAAEEVVTQEIPLTTMLRELNLDEGAVNLFGGDDDASKPLRDSSSPKVPYFKTKLEIRPVHDHTVHSPSSLSQGPFRKLRVLPKHGVYQPYLYVSDFWLLEKDFLPLNASLADQRLNLTLSYSVVTLWIWSMQVQMAEQWSVKSDLGLTDPQRESFMMKRLLIDTNPYLLGFSGAFLLLHTIFSLLAFKNDIQFWRQNESMKGLSARTMIVSFVCQLIIALYLLNSQEASKLILFQILLDVGLAFWKLRKAVQLKFDLSFPFVHVDGQAGYDEDGTAQYDREAVSYVASVIMPIFAGYCIRSLFYGKHRGFYSYIIGSAAGGVYTFGFIMMTPQLYINYKLKSVEHLPWRALTYKAMNTFVDDVAALLIDMPMMHRLSCFRDDVIFFIYIFQRWRYRVDRSRPTMYTSPEDARPEAALPDVPDDSDAPAASVGAPEAEAVSKPAEVPEPRTEANDVDSPTGDAQRDS